jgi:hypothetical protein
VPLLVDDVVELAVDLVVDAAEVMAVESLLALLAEPGEQIAQPLQPFPFGAAHALLQHPAQRGIDVTVVQQLVGQLVEQEVGVDVEAALGSVPSRVREPCRHEVTVTRE